MRNLDIRDAQLQRTVPLTSMMSPHGQILMPQTAAAVELQLRTSMSAVLSTGLDR